MNKIIENIKNRNEMKYSLSVFAFIALTLFLTACGGDAPVTLKEWQEKKKTLLEDLKLAEEQIALLDTTTKKVKFVDVEVMTVTKKPYESFIEVQGVVESDDNIDIMPETQGVIKSIRVKEGQTVSKGKVLATLDTDVLRSQLKEAEKSFELAEDLYKKQKNLREQNVGSEVEFLQVKNQKEVLEQQIKTVKSQISKAVITAPIAGKIDKIFPNEGELANPQAPFARIVNPNRGYYVDADVSEVYFRKINTGDSIEIKFPFLEESYDAVINSKGNFINPGNRTFKVRSRLKTSGKSLAPNLLSVVRLRDIYEPEAISVPQMAIQTDLEGYFLYVVTKGKSAPVEKRRIAMKHVYDNQALLNDELAPGEQIVTKARWDKLNATDFKLRF